MASALVSSARCRAAATVAASTASAVARRGGVAAMRGAATSAAVTADSTTPRRYPTVGVAATIFPRHPASGALLVSHVALIQRGTPPMVGSWSFPGGRAEWGEDIAAAGLREAREETGLAVHLLGGAVPAYAATDAITGPAGGPPQYHYGIAHVLTWVDAVVDAAGGVSLPPVCVGDDASAGAWVATGLLPAPSSGSLLTYSFASDATGGGSGSGSDGGGGGGSVATSIAALESAGALIPFVRHVLELAPAAAAARGATLAVLR
mgnify:CR=1 FL=1